MHKYLYTTLDHKLSQLNLAIRISIEIDMRYMNNIKCIELHYIQSSKLKLHYKKRLANDKL